MSDAGANVRLVRQQVGMSLRAVADAAKLDPATLSRVENGKQQLTGDLAKRIAEVLHVSVGIFFSDPGVVETAMLKMRKAPLLESGQLPAWKGPDSFEEAANQVYLHTSVTTGSRHLFAICVFDDANAPEVMKGDQVVFDAMREPKFGDLVIAESDDGVTAIGLYRPAQPPHREPFDVVPVNRMFPEVNSAAAAMKLRGVRCEQRRVF